ncbi:hypothetical protein QE152_g33940 [Popillia japonica]|uniref:Uncharacterized protein n=1 Tax=Popillia japonica TaxID=7064 RepID=A0AAW1IV16_POPJA
MFSKIQKTNECVRGPDDSRLDVLGKIEVTLSHEIRSFNTHIYVIRNLERPILGRFGIEKLRILELQCHNNSVRNVERSDSILNEFPKIFQDVGNLKTEMSIQLKPNSKPYIRSVPRKVPIPILPKLKDEFDRLIKLEIHICRK